MEAQNRIILVGLKFSILVAQSAIMLDHPQTGDDDEKQLGWMTTHNLGDVGGDDWSVLPNRPVI